MNSGNTAKAAPSCISGFASAPLSTNSDAEVAYGLACRECGGTTFQIESHSIVAPDPSPYFGIAPGETLHRPPHKLLCAGCRKSVPLFDAKTQGYDGVLNGGCAYESGEGEGTLAAGEFKFVAAFRYNIEQSELEELAAEAKVQPSDLFDSMSIIGVPVHKGSRFEIAYECA